jgi:hypothetical protein
MGSRSARSTTVALPETRDAEPRLRRDEEVGFARFALEAPAIERAVRRALGLVHDEPVS